MNIIADTSFAVAITNIRDHDHNACMEVYRQQENIILLQSVLTELVYLLSVRGGNHLAVGFLTRLPTSRFAVMALEPEDIQRTTELLTQYVDTRLDFVDATVVAVAERLNITRVLTLDQRDFRMVRPRHCEYFEILPDVT